MATVMKTPGVYREEVSLFPPSVAAVDTAVPAFVGYTQKATSKKGNLKFKAVEIRSIAEFREVFGTGPDVNVDSIKLTADNAVSEVVLNSDYYLYDSMRLYYDNGGGRCFVVSVGSFDESVDAENLKQGLEAIALEDQPTMLVVPDAIALGDEAIYGVQQAALKQCGDLRDRFAILDLLEIKDNIELDLSESVKEFRNEIGTSNLKYAAAYVPHLRANLPKTATYRNIRNKLRKFGAVFKESELMPEGSASKLAAVNNAIADVDSVKKAISEYVKEERGPNPEIKAISQVYELTLKDLKEQLGKMSLTPLPAGQLNTTIAAYRNLLELTYKLVVAAVDDHAKPDANNNLKISETRDFARSQIENILLPELKRLNRMTIDANTHIGGAASNNKLYRTAAFNIAADEWDDAYDATLTALTGDDLRAIYPKDTSGLTGADQRAARTKNIASAAKQVNAVFGFVSDSVIEILGKAKEIERKAGDAIRDAAPQIRNIIDEVASAQSTIPPSGIMAGIYSQVDGTRGVFKAPANVSLSNITDLTENISHDIQAGLNVDALAGKSINAIRPFLGRGKLVWGARTLDGNSNEWRYISVRRFFNMVEESCKNASERFVFEPNDRNTWVKVGGMIENFLLIQWRSGALQGAVPEDAFFVKVGLGETMTALDILEGRMIVEIGMAVVRPAEFIVLRFSHKMPVS